MVVRRTPSIGCAFAWLVAASPVLAEAPPLELSWNAPAGCPSGAEVRRQYERLAKAPENREPPRLVADATVEQVGERWHLRLHIDRDGLAGEREVEAASCVSLARAAALELALAAGGGFIADADAAPEPPAPPPPPNAGKESSAPPDSVVVAPPRSDATVRSIAWWASLDGRYASGILPGGALGTAAGVDARHGWWMVSARLVAWPHAREELLPGVRATFGAVGGSLSGCFVGTVSDSVSLAGCLGLQASAMTGSSSGGSAAGSALAAWYAAVPEARARLRLVGDLALDLGVQPAISLTRPRFVLLGWAPPAYVVPLFAPSASVGLALRI